MQHCIGVQRSNKGSKVITHNHFSHVEVEPGEEACVPLVLGHVEGHFVSLADLSLIVDVSEGIRDEEELATSLVDDAAHSWIHVWLAGLGA